MSHENLIHHIGDIKVCLDRETNLRVNESIDKFAESMGNRGQSASYYGENRNTSALKAAKDISLGSKSEHIAARVLTDNFGFPKVAVDLDVRVGSRKGWRVDLPFSSIDEAFPDVHVKSCDIGTYRYCNGDYSWTFQYSNSRSTGGRDDIFASTKPSLVAFVYMEDHKDAEGIVKAILPWSCVKTLLKDPLKDSLRGLKKCVYYKDVLASR